MRKLRLMDALREQLHPWLLLVPLQMDWLQERRRRGRPFARPRYLEELLTVRVPTLLAHVERLEPRLKLAA